MVDTLATKYVEARKGLDERIEALQAENKGLVDKAIGAIKAIINTIRQLAAMLKNVLSRVAGVVGDIIKNPIGFLGNLIAGVKGGILKFKDNILDHLRKGLMSWLFGALAEGGIEIPDKLDIKGIIKLLASLFGLTWANIRNRLVKQIGEKAMAAAEKGVEIFKIIATEGIGGLWQMLIEKLGDIKEMILEQVKDFVITKIITAGITWLIGLLNPAAAFIKACKLIYDVVMFFVSNAARIVKFVNTVIDSVADIVRGNVSGVVNKINDVLGQMVPIIIGFLASVIGLGGIGQKIRQIVQTLQKPINKALDFVIKTGLKLAGPIIRGIKGISGKVKAKVAAGKAWVKGKAGAVKAKLLGGDDSPAGKQQRLEKGVRGGVSAANRFAGKTVGDRVLRPMLGAIRVRYGLSTLEPVKQGSTWAVHGEVQRMTSPTLANASDVSAPGGKVEPAPPGTAPLNLPFEMAGKSHTIDVTAGQNPVITMHSVHGGELLAKIQTALRAPGLPPTQLADLQKIEALARKFRMLIIGHVRAKTQCPPGAPEISDLLTAIKAYGSIYKATDFDPMAGQAASLRLHGGYTWLAGLGLADQFEARILAQLGDFPPGKIKKILDVMDKYKAHPALEQKVRKAVETNRFWSPNHGSFFEIGDMRSINDVRFMEVNVGGRVIDMLTGAGLLVDQKYLVAEKLVSATPGGPATPQLDPRLVAQATAMAGAASGGQVISGIPVTGWEIHYAQPLTPAIAAMIAARGWTGNFVRSTEARSYL